MDKLLISAAERNCPGAMTVADLLRTAGIDPTDARVLLQHVLSVEHARLIAQWERTPRAEESARFVQLAARRCRGEPIAYLVGWREFYGRRFGVDASVLIPRPESELLIDLALQRLADRRGPSILDLGTGSGNIGLTLALERLDAKVTAVDLSKAALARARANARLLGAEHVELLEGDWFAPVVGRRFDLVVSNPPYVAEGDAHLEQGDVRFEPRSALAAGLDGLACIRAIVGRAHRVLNPGGWLLFEHGYDQSGACASLLERAGYVDLVHARDLAGLPRVSGGRLLQKQAA